VQEIRDVRDCIALLQDMKNAVEREDSNAFAYPCGGRRFPFGLWFRGEANYQEECRSCARPLTPRVFRGTNTNNAQYYSETSLYQLMPTRIDELRARASVFQKLSTMQHYDVPSRLLDWTESVLVALYFAVRSNPEIDSTLYVLNTRKLNHITGLRTTWDNLHLEGDFGTLFRCEFVTATSQRTWFRTIHSKHTTFDWTDPKLPARYLEQALVYPDTKIPHFALEDHCTPIAVYPNRINQRMAVQSSTFTLHGGKCYAIGDHREKPDDSIPPPKHLLDLSQSTDSSKQFLQMFAIPKAEKRRLKRQLFEIGIHESTLFPEIDKQGQYIEVQFR